MPDNALIEKVVLSEISGKNTAIAAYDAMIWRVRTGCLTLLFVGWAVLLKSIVDQPGALGAKVRPLVGAVFIYSCGLAFAGWLIDRSYVRRKFRVILALDRLFEQLLTTSDNVPVIPFEVMKVAGDNAAMPFRCPGYDETVRTSDILYFSPLLTLAVAGVFSRFLISVDHCGQCRHKPTNLASVLGAWASVKTVLRQYRPQVRVVLSKPCTFVHSSSRGPTCPPAHSSRLLTTICLVDELTYLFKRRGGVVPFG